MILTLDQARAQLRQAVFDAGGAAVFAKKHPLLTEDKIADWISPRGGMPSMAAFNMAGMRVSLKHRANGKVLTVFETVE
jgi:hypothetical protein